jgi:hypothetical protein
VRIRRFKEGTVTKALTIAVLLFLVHALSAQILVAAPLLQEQLYEIASPQANAQLRGSVNIVGSARWPDFWFYKVEYSSAATPEAWAVIGDTHEEQRSNETLEIWHTTALPDGAYYLHLVVVKTDGNLIATEPIPVQIANTQPTATPVPVETPTPTPTIFMPTPTTAIVEQPTTVIRLTPTAESEIVPIRTVTPETPEGGISFPDLGVFVRQFAFGAFVTAAIFVFVGIVFLLRRLI